MLKLVGHLIFGILIDLKKKLFTFSKLWIYYKKKNQHSQITAHKSSISKNSAQKIDDYVGWVVSFLDLYKPNVVHIIFFNFW